MAMGACLCTRVSSRCLPACASTVPHVSTTSGCLQAKHVCSYARLCKRWRERFCSSASRNARLPRSAPLAAAADGRAACRGPWRAARPLSLPPATAAAARMQSSSSAGPTRQVGLRQAGLPPLQPPSARQSAPSARHRGVPASPPPPLQQQQQLRPPARWCWWIQQRSAPCCPPRRAPPSRRACWRWGACWRRCRAGRPWCCGRAS